MYDREMLMSYVNHWFLKPKLWPKFKKGYLEAADHGPLKIERTFSR